MSQIARWVGLTLATAMLVFSAWMYLQTGDWVALLFVGGSLAYGVFFIAGRRRSQS
jgi:hypothetical protein